MIFRRGIHAGVALVLAASAACQPPPRYQKGTNSSFLAATLDPSSKRMMDGYKKVPAVFVRRLEEAGASCAPQQDGTLCVYLYADHRWSRDFWIWEVAQGLISSRRVEDYGTRDGPGLKLDCGGSMREQQNGYLRRLGGRIECGA